MKLTLFDGPYKGYEVDLRGEPKFIYLRQTIAAMDGGNTTIQTQAFPMACYKRVERQKLSGVQVSYEFDISKSPGV